MKNSKKYKLKRNGKEKYFLITIIAIIILFVCKTESKAAISIVPSQDGTGKDVITNLTISSSYLHCRNLTSSGSTLKGATVASHLATNKDWGAVSYLSNSNYGAGTAGGNKGKQITIDNVKYYSTNGNVTGIMNWGENPNYGYYGGPNNNYNNDALFTYTSGIMKTYSSSNPSNNIISLYENKNTRFVDIIDTEQFDNITTKGMALSETNGLYNSWNKLGTNQSYPVSWRRGLMGYSVGWYSGNDWGLIYICTFSNGAASSYVTFRPVVWNK